MGISDWFKRNKPAKHPASEQSPASDAANASEEPGCSIDGFPLDAPPDAEVHTRINDLLQKAHANLEESVQAFSDRVAAFVPLFIDRVELHRAALVRLVWYAEEKPDVGRRTIETVKRIYESTFDQAKSYLSEADLISTLALRSRLKVSWTHVNDARIVDLLREHPAQTTASAEMKSAVERYSQHLEKSGSPTLFERVEVLLGRRAADESKADHLPAAVLDAIVKRSPPDI